MKFQGTIDFMNDLNTKTLIIYIKLLMGAEDKNLILRKYRYEREDQIPSQLKLIRKALRDGIVQHNEFSWSFNSDGVGGQSFEDIIQSRLIVVS